MDDTTEQQHDALIDRYLQARMSAEEQAAFEIRMLEEPELLARVQLLEALQRELRAQEAALLATGPDAAATSATVLPFSKWLRQPLSLAASVLIALLGVSALMNSPDVTPVPAALQVNTLLLLEARRDSSVPTFSGAGPYLVQVDAGLGNQVATLNLTLTDTATDTVLLREQGVTVDGDGWVRLLYTQRLRGEYRLELAWTDAAGTPATLAYDFQVR